MGKHRAGTFIARYFRTFPSLQRWLNLTKREAARIGYVETILGRRRYLPRLLSNSGVNAERRSRAEREAINTPVQGSAADIMKLAMLKLHARLLHDGYAAGMTLQVHDEVVLDCPLEEAEVGIGPNWDEA